jgi:hypothetical protein
LHNGGTVEVQSGAINLAAGGSGAGNFVLAGGTVLEFGGGTYTMEGGAGISAGAVVRVTGGTVSFSSSDLNLALLELTNGVANLNGSGQIGQLLLTTGTANFNGYSRVGQLQFSGGTMGGTNTVVVTNATWTGGTMGGKGVTSIPAGGQWQISGNADKVFSDRTLANAGNVVWSGGGALSTTWSGAVAVINNAPGAVFEVQTDAPLAVPWVSSFTFYNAGRLVKTAGAGTNLFNGVSLQNIGTVEVQSGTLNLSGGITEASSGTLSFGLSSTIDFGRITVPGTVNFTGRICATLLGGYLPPTNSMFEVMSFGSRTGDFTDTNCLTTSQGVQFECEFTSTNLLLRTIREGTNVPPTVALTSPSDGAVVQGPTNVLLTVNASDTDGWLIKVEFMADGQKLGETTNAPYSFIWADPPAGSHILSARATDNQGGWAVSTPVSISVVIGCDQVLFEENFESYLPGSSPTNGGWQLASIGEGTASQIVDTNNHVSGSRSLRLVGSVCLPANTFHSAPASSDVTVDVSVCVKSLSQAGCSPYPAIFGPFNPAPGGWGTYFGAVAFGADGNIHAITQSYPTPTATVPLMKFTTNQWYRIRSAVDLKARTFDVYVDGVLRQAGLPFADSGEPIGICLAAGNGTAPNPTVWYDDLVVSPCGPYGPLPTLTISMTYGAAALTLWGVVGKTNSIEYATDLTSTAKWLSLTTLSLPHSPYLFLDQFPTNAQQRFYRAVQSP